MALLRQRSVVALRTYTSRPKARFARCGRHHDGVCSVLHVPRPELATSSGLAPGVTLAMAQCDVKDLWIECVVFI